MSGVVQDWLFSRAKFSLHPNTSWGGLRLSRGSWKQGSGLRKENNGYPCALCVQMQNGAAAAESLVAPQKVKCGITMTLQIHV